MTKHDIAKLVSRVFSIYMLVQTFNVISQTLYGVSYYFNQPEPSPGMDPLIVQNILSAVIGAFYLIATLFLWLKADRVAEKMTGEPGDADESLVLNDIDLRSIAYSVIGIFLIVDSVARLAGIAGSYIYKNLIENSLLGSPIDVNAFSFVEPSLRLVLGLALFLGSRGLSNAVHKLRTAGRDKLPNAQTN